MIDYFKNKYNIDYVDIITIPGANKIIADNEDNIMETIKWSLTISLKVHKSKMVAIVGHYNCAGNPADKKRNLRTQMPQLRL